MSAPFEKPDVRRRAERSIIELSFDLAGGTRSLSADGKRPARLLFKVATAFRTVNRAETSRVASGFALAHDEVLCRGDFLSSILRGCAVLRSAAPGTSARSRRTSRHLLPTAGH